MSRLAGAVILARIVRPSLAGDFAKPNLEISRKVFEESSEEKGLGLTWLSGVRCTKDFTTLVRFPTSPPFSF